MNITGKYTLIGIILLLTVVFAIVDPVFISPANLLNLLDQIAIIGLIALGMTVVIIIGGIDLSVGSIVAFAGIVLASSLANGHSLTLSILLCLLSGVVLGAINGALIAYGKIPAFIATLGMMTFARGAALNMTDGRSVSGFPETLNGIVGSSVFGLSASVVLFITLATALYLFLVKTYPGKYIYAIGDNEQAAFLAGINVKRYKLIAYSLLGFLSAAASILLVGKLDSAQPQAGNMYELNAIAMVVIGGASLTGGRGKITNTMLGILIVGILQNGFSILNIPSYYQQMLIGVILIVAVWSDFKFLKVKIYEKK